MAATEYSRICGAPFVAGGFEVQFFVINKELHLNCKVRVINSQHCMHHIQLVSEEKPSNDAIYSRGLYI